jgi:TetR/AcrR family transcriptional repressor of nem operon
MTTQDAIVDLADDLIRDKGYNAFSFHDIAKRIGIKTASIHYHFPTKGDLGVAVIKKQVEKFEVLRAEFSGKDPMKKLQAFFSIYSRVQADHKICLVGSLSTDLHTLDKKVKAELKIFAGLLLDWVTKILEEGRTKKVFSFHVPPRTKAILLITNMLAIVQLSRLTGDHDFDIVKKATIKELTLKQAK